MRAYVYAQTDECNDASKGLSTTVSPYKDASLFGSTGRPKTGGRSGDKVACILAVKWCFCFVRGPGIRRSVKTSFEKRPDPKVACKSYVSV
jgi:hypothetical protein